MSLTFNKVLKFFAFSMIFVLITEDLSGQRRQRSQTSSSRSARDAGTQTDTSGDEYDHEVDPTGIDGIEGKKNAIPLNMLMPAAIKNPIHNTRFLKIFPAFPVMLSGIWVVG